jgi:ubiquinone/menaquinone biosynthesis C-methylase UbiE
VLEIGCGDGRLIWRYGHETAAIHGVDTNLDKLRRALGARPQTLAAKTRFYLSSVEALPFADASFDLAIFGWSL